MYPLFFLPWIPRTNNISRQRTWPILIRYLSVPVCLLLTTRYSFFFSPQVANPISLLSSIMQSDCRCLNVSTIVYLEVDEFVFEQTQAQTSVLPLSSGDERLYGWRLRVPVVFLPPLWLLMAHRSAWMWIAPSRWTVGGFRSCQKTRVHSQLSARVSKCRLAVRYNLHTWLPFFIK